MLDRNEFSAVVEIRPHRIPIQTNEIWPFASSDTASDFCQSCSIAFHFTFFFLQTGLLVAMEILELVHPGLYYHYRQGPLGTDIFVNRDFFFSALNNKTQNLNILLKSTQNYNLRNTENKILGVFFPVFKLLNHHEAFASSQISQKKNFSFTQHFMKMSLNLGNQSSSKNCAQNLKYAGAANIYRLERNFFLYTILFSYQSYLQAVAISRCFFTNQNNCNKISLLILKLLGS